MTVSAQAGPEITWGQLPPIVPGSAPPDYNPDAGPSGDFCGRGLLDLRYGFKIGGAGNSGNSPLVAIIFPPSANYSVIDQVPSAASTTNIAAAQHVANGVPMSLVTTSGSGVTVTTAAQFIPQTGLTVPAGALALDGPPGILTFGQNGSVGVPDPTKALARAVQIAAAASAAGGVIQVQGYDLYGRPQTENITTVANTTVVGKKAFKWVTALVPQFTDATYNYNAGISDVYGLPLRADVYGYVDATFNNVPVTSPTFVAAATATATSTTGDVRGTIAVTSDGTKRLQITQGISPANMLTTAGNFGVTPA